jgi:ATP-binding cassette subfamily C (CFTR/MRP) protein 4
MFGNKINFRKKTARITDERIKMTNEVLNGIKVIKMYSWEEPFQNIVRAIRK